MATSYPRLETSVIFYEIIFKVEYISDILLNAKKYLDV